MRPVRQAHRAARGVRPRRWPGKLRAVFSIHRMQRLSPFCVALQEGGPMKVLGRQMWVHSWRFGAGGASPAVVQFSAGRSGARRAGVPQGGLLPRRLSVGGKQ